MNKKLQHYECESCDSVFEVHSDSLNKLPIVLCPFCGETIGEGYEVECDE